jgi:hypothetical protein
MRSNILFLILSLLVSSELFSQSNFSHPLRIEPSSVFTKIRVDGQARENREANFYEREQSLRLEGEYKLGKYFSIMGSLAGRKHDSSGSRTMREMDRYSLGLKFAREHGDEKLRFSYGAGVKGFSKFDGTNLKSETSGDLYLVRPNLTFGLGIGKLEIITELSLQSETNSRFREDERQDFRRHYAGGLSVSYGLGEKFRIFLETEYKEPYSKRIDTKVRSWYIYPGLSYKIYEGGFLSFSGQYQIQIENYNWDTGIRISYFHFF